MEAIKSTLRTSVTNHKTLKTYLDITDVELHLKGQRITINWVDGREQPQERSYHLKEVGVWICETYGYSFDQAVNFAKTHLTTVMIRRFLEYKGEI